MENLTIPHSVLKIKIASKELEDFPLEKYDLLAMGVSGRLRLLNLLNRKLALRRLSNHELAQALSERKDGCLRSNNGIIMEMFQRIRTGQIKVKIPKQAKNKKGR